MDSVDGAILRELKANRRLSMRRRYLLKLEAGSHAQVEGFLDQLLHHANDRLNLALSSTAQED